MRVVSPKPSTEVLGSGGDAGRFGVLSRWRRTGNRGAGLRDGERSARGQDCRAREIRTSPRRRSWCRLIARLIFSRARPRHVILSDSGNPEYIAADLVAQAEHDVETLSLFDYDIAQTGSMPWRGACCDMARENPTAKKSLPQTGSDFDCRLSQASARMGESPGAGAHHG